MKVTGGLTQVDLDAPAAKVAADAKVVEAEAALAELVAAAIRPLLAIVAGIDTKEDRDKVKKLAEKAKAVCNDNLKGEYKNA